MSDSPWAQFRRSMLPPRREKALVASTQVLEAAQDRVLNLNIKLAQNVRDAWQQFQSAGYGYLYSHQPAVRQVVDYIAVNVAQLAPKLYERVSDTERQERGDHPAAQALRDPNPWTPGKQFIFDIFADFLVYNNAYALKVQPSPGGRRFLLSVPASNIAVLGRGVSQLAGYQIFRTDGSSFFVQPEEVIHWRGYDASDRRMGVSKLETLRSELAEQAATQRANVDLMESGLQQRGYIKRPVEASDWNQTGGRARFLEQFRAAMKRADRGYPILEEGMEIAPLGVSPKDAQMLDSRKLFTEEVAKQYGMVHCPPEGEDERRQFYADVLPPITNLFCDVLRLSLLQQEYALDNYYFEFNMDQKRISDDRLRALTSAAGRPVMAANEARSYLDLPPLNFEEAEDDSGPTGEDRLALPANVTIPGVITGTTSAAAKPSIGTMPTQNPNGPDQGGGFRRDQEPLPPGETEPPPKSLLNGRHEAEVAETLVRLYKRQENVLAAGNKFDISRWNRELSADLGDIFDQADPDALEAIANQINSTTMAAITGPEPKAAFAKLKAEAVHWAQDIDRARVMLVAASLLNAGESGESEDH